MQGLVWRRFRRAAAWLPVVAGVAAHGVLAQAEETAGTWRFHHEGVMGTSLELRVAAADVVSARAMEAAVLAELDRQAGILSAWRAGSEFRRWAGTRGEAVAVSPELMEVLAGFDRWRERTGGALDASAEAAVRLWRGAAAEGREPGEAELEAVVRAMGQRHWALDADGGTAVRLTEVPLALASFSKGVVSARAAEAGMAAGGKGVMLNVGGDVVVRGELRQVVDIADPRASAENDPPLDRVVVRDRAVATSGGYRRGMGEDAPLRTPEWTHLVDPRTGRPAGHVLSSTVIAGDAETAGALATAFSVMSVAESRALAERTPGAEFLLVRADGRQVRSEGWARYQAPGIRPVVFAPARGAAMADAGAWNPAFELAVGLELPRIADGRYRRPYVAVWVEDADHFPVRTLALWTQNPRWLPELKQWYRDDRVRNLSEGTDVSKTISAATRPPGQYSLKWDGKDNAGKPVKAGRYTVVVEAAREHGGYQVERHEMDFDGQAQTAKLPAGAELGTVTLDYRKR